MKRRHALAAVLSLVFALGILAGCGKSSSSASVSAHATPDGGQLVAIAADPSGALAYTAKTIQAAPGELAIEFTNHTAMGHNLTVSTEGGKVLGATTTFQGGTRTLSLYLRDGVYDFYCSVPGHREAGMQGTLTVK